MQKLQRRLLARDASAKKYKAAVEVLKQRLDTSDQVRSYNGSAISADSTETNEHASAQVLHPLRIGLLLGSCSHRGLPLAVKPKSFTSRNDTYRRQSIKHAREHVQRTR